MQVAIKKVLQDKRFKNRELQIIRLMEHPNVVLLKHCFFSVTDADERFLHLVLEFIPSTVYKCAYRFALTQAMHVDVRMAPGLHCWLELCCPIGHDSFIAPCYSSPELSA